MSKTMVTAVLAACIAAVLWTLWATYGDHVAQFFSATPNVGAGAWGDTFGALNALFSAAAFIAVLLTLASQRRALRVQQGEIVDARQDQHRQRFESSFFELLSLMRELRKEIHYEPPYHPRLDNFPPNTGLDAIANAANRVVSVVLIDGAEEPLLREQVGAVYTSQVHILSEAGLGPYFRVIYTILDRIRSDGVLTNEEKAKYGNLLRSQLSSHEVVLVSFNGLTPISKDLADLLAIFRIPKYIPEGSARETLKRFYPKEAFEPRD